MYATAHLVCRREGEEGINAFLHHHGADYPWPKEAWRLPEERPGKIVKQAFDLRPGGNSVRAYLDVLAPDGTPVDQIRAALAIFEEELCERRNPTVFQHAPGRVTIRFGVEGNLEAVREERLRDLEAALLRLLRGG
jgi:hypothetical protein